MHAPAGAHFTRGRLERFVLNKFAKYRKRPNFITVLYRKPPGFVDTSLQENIVLRDKNDAKTSGKKKRILDTDISWKRIFSYVRTYVHNHRLQLTG
jgi:hypothetical protein